MSDINQAFLRLSRRAESVDRATLIETFVDVGALFTLLSTRDHQVLHGRRGTGKTHALLYLAGTVAGQGDIAIYVDLRTIGSTGGIYADESLPIAERATRLLMDTLSAIHDALLDQVLASEDGSLNLAAIGPALDDLASAITEVQVVGGIETEAEATLSRSAQREDRGSIRAGSDGIAGELGGGSRGEVRSEARETTKRIGELRHRVHFGHVGAAMQQIASRLSGKRVWLLLDEWSTLPPILQPYLADLLRRSLFAVTGVTIKIAAIEQRTDFKLPGPQGTYIGIELGADIAADLNLDDFMVFENDAVRATQFFEQLLWKHYLAVAAELNLQTRPTSGSRLVQEAFTQRPTFEEFVRAAEGVPRDAINILSLTAQRAGDSQISRDHLRAAARTWFQRDKEAALVANSEARSLLHWIIDEVIAHRRARAFLLRTTVRHPLIDALFDARVLHVLKRNISSQEEPGLRYDAYKIDYGCYVDLLATARAPEGLLSGADEGEFVDVPPDDYRAIRRAVLDLRRFDAAVSGSS